MGESKTSEKLNGECNNIFVDKSQTQSEKNEMNESIASTDSLIDETLLLRSHYDAQIKEETMNFFARENSLSPIFPQSKTMKQEYENYDSNFANTDDINDESDEETIATFITAAGQQLALYAVEDSEEIFAVAVYDESGLPPTDFQFLMKSDVEKLIGEGAIRTVKKPSQLKNQVYALDNSFTPINENLQSPPPLTELSEISPEPQNSFENIKQEKSDESTLTNSQRNLDCAESTDVKTEVIYENWSDNVILLIQNDNSVDNVQNNELPEINEIDNEIIEKSTVQYILSDDPPDSSDLTLDDIEQVLNKTNHPDDNLIVNNPVERVNIKMENNLINQNYSDDLSEQAEDDKNYTKDNTTESVDFMRTKRPRKQQLTIVNRTDSEIIIQQTTITSMNDNYEVDDYDKRKKRGRKRKKKETKINNGPYMRTRRRSISSNKNGKKYRIEVIDIDMDDVNREIINLEEGKEKGSSDKENEIIMVGDSDDDDDDDDNKDEEVEVDDSDDSDYENESKKKRRRSPRKLEAFDCRECNKKFRQKKLLISHSRVCKRKERVNERIRRGPMRSVRLTRELEVRGKKDYECKVCHERFDVVVALARHVRLMHSLRKRGNGESDEEKLRGKGRGGARRENMERGGRRTRSSLGNEKKIIERRKRKERFNLKIRRLNAWKNPSTRKINCRECGRWFPGLALLLAHSLQHATKKIVSEKSKVRRCQLCKKIFKSRFLFICHMRMHSNIVPLRRNHSSTIKKTEKSKKIMKKRGKPQKL